MWPEGAYNFVGLLTGVSDVWTTVGGLEVVDQYGALGRAGFLFAVTVLVGTLILGVLPNYGTRTIETSRRSPIISVVVGTPGALVIAALTYIGFIISGTSLGVFFAIPLVVLGVLLLPTWTALGLVAIAGTLSRYAGIERRWLSVLLGGGLAAISVAIPQIGVGILVAGMIIGVGAGIRTSIGYGATTKPNERVVPPANKV